MAQGPNGFAPTNGATSNGTSFEKAAALHEIAELKKIVQFRDTVLSGRHPLIKLPANIASSRNVSSPNTLPPRPPPQSAPQSKPSTSTQYTENSSALYNIKPQNAEREMPGSASASHPLNASASKSEINPIFLEKSDDLIKAEILLQRQRLERGLRDQVEARRISMRAAQQTSESLPDFDLSEVLVKALSIVHPGTVEAEPSVGAHASSDSFDENTFYSSQHDTPEPVAASLAEKNPERVQALAVSSTDRHSTDHRDDIARVDDEMEYVPSFDAPNADVAGIVRKPSPRVDSWPVNNSHPPFIPGNASSMAGQAQPSAMNQRTVIDISKGDSDKDMSDSVPSQSGKVSGNSATSPLSMVEQFAVQNTTQELMEQAFPRSPSIFAANLSPFAPQPARVSPLLQKQSQMSQFAAHSPFAPLPQTAQGSPIVVEDQFPMSQQSVPIQHPISQTVATPKGPTGASSPEGSRKGNKKKDRKKKNRRSQGGKESAVDTPDTPYIKPEPRSPSPMNVAPLPRPHKRQRQTFNQELGLNYDEPSRHESLRQDLQERNTVNSYPVERARPQPSYHRLDDDRIYDSGDAEVRQYRPAPREEQPLSRRVVSHETRRTPVPAMYVAPYSPSDPRMARAASHVVVERPPQEAPRYYRQEVAQPRPIIRDDADRNRSRSPVMYDQRLPVAMAPPPMIAHRRIMVDEYGREFYAAPLPPPPASRLSRASVAPTAINLDEEPVYGRPPPRAIPRAVAETYEQDGVLYRRASPASFAAPPPRRVLTEPEYGADDRPYRTREYSVRPVIVAPQNDEYGRSREPMPVPGRHVSHFEEAPPREYMTRGASVRPDPTRYEAPREYIQRMSSVRPEATSREYQPSARPEPRREAPVHAIREYSVRPAEADNILQYDGAYSVPKPVVRRMVEDVEYVEQPRQAPQQMYADDGRQRVYYR